MGGLDVGIVGAGTAGAAAAILLARLGHRVHLYERVPNPTAVGAGIVLQPTGQLALAALGLLAPVLDHGARIDRLRCLDRAGRPVVDLGYPQVDGERFGLGIHRGILFETLLGAARREPNVTLSLGVEVARSRLSRAGRELFDRDGACLGGHELVVAADGAGSALRAGGDVPSRTLEYPYGALWFIGDDPARAFGTTLLQLVEDTRKMLGYLPSGRAPGDPVPKVSLYYSVRLDRVPTLLADLDRLKAEMLELWPPGAPVLAQVTRPEQLLVAKYRHVVMPRWHGERIVFLGDAGHAMSPQLGQGANLALFDAFGLAAALAGGGALPAALAAYSRARARHLGYYQLATRLLTPWFQSDHAWIGHLRDQLMPLAARVPWVRRQMMQSMWGVQAGLFGRVAAPPAIPRDRGDRGAGNPALSA